MTDFRKRDFFYAKECMKYGCFIDNGAVSEKDLWKDGIHLIESGRVIVANNLINYLY